MSIPSENAPELEPSRTEANVFLSPDGACPSCRQMPKLGTRTRASTGSAARTTGSASRILHRAARRGPQRRRARSTQAIQSRPALCAVSLLAVGAALAAFLPCDSARQQAPSATDTRPATPASADGSRPTVPARRDPAAGQPAPRHVEPRRRTGRRRRPSPPTAARRAAPAAEPAIPTPAPGSRATRPSPPPTAQTRPRRALPLPVPDGAPPEFM
jgi:hypothetical protein